jgi:PilZ domain
MSSPGIKAAMARMLLICNDSAAIQQVAEGTQQFAIATEVCNEVSMALRLLNRQRFEAVVVDFGLDQAGEILEQIRLSPSNRTAVTFAIAGPQKPDSLQIQPNFWIEKPLSVGSVGRTLKAAFGLIVRERRRSFRCPVAFPAVILANGNERNCQVVNISESGMAIAESGSLKPGKMAKVMFTLPGHFDPFTFESEVCWFDEKGRAGLRLLIMPPDQKSTLQHGLPRSSKNTCRKRWPCSSARRRNDRFRVGTPPRSFTETSRLQWVTAGTCPSGQVIPSQLLG